MFNRFDLDIFSLRMKVSNIEQNQIPILISNGLPQHVALGGFNNSYKLKQFVLQK